MSEKPTPEPIFWHPKIKKKISEKFHFQHGDLPGYGLSSIPDLYCSINSTGPSSKKRGKGEKLSHLPQKSLPPFLGGPHHRMTAPKSAWSICHGKNVGHPNPSQSPSCPRLSEEKGFLEIHQLNGGLIPWEDHQNFHGGLCSKPCLITGWGPRLIVEI